MNTATKQIDKNFSQHATRVAGKTEGMQMHHSDHLTISNCGLSCDTFNIIHIVDGKNITNEELTLAVKLFKDSELEYCIWVTSENLTPRVEQFFSANSISKQNEEIGMVLDLANYVPVQNEHHQSISVVSSKESIEAYARVIARNWHPIDQNVLKFYDLTSGNYLAESEKITLLLHLEKDEPVATLEMFEDEEGIMGLYGLSTVSNYQGIGIGSSMMSFALNRAKELRYEQVVLQATEDGIEIYKKYGFVPITTYFEFA